MFAMMDAVLLVAALMAFPFALVACMLAALGVAAFLDYLGNIKNEILKHY